MSSVRTPQQNGVVERQNRTLVEAARTMLIFYRAPLFLWVEAIATACFTQNRSIIHRRFNKTQYELINGRKLDILFLHVFGALCYPKNDRKEIRKLGAKGDIGFLLDTLLIPMLTDSKPGLQSMTSGHISSGLDLTYAPSTITTQQPFKGELDLLFKAMYDDYIGGQPLATARTVLPAQEPQVLERHNWTLVKAARTMFIFSHALLFLWAEAIATACFTQNRSIIHRRLNKTPYELINGRKPNISFLYVFGALCYPKNDREDIGKLGAKDKEIMETMNVSFDELSAMAFDQRSLNPGINSITSGQISLGLDLTYAPSTITTQQPTEGELDLLFEAMYDDYIGGQPSATARTVSPAQEPQVRQMSTASTTIADIAPTPKNSSSLATNIPITSQDVNELNLNAMLDGNMFVNPFANSSISTAASSSSQNVDPSNMHTFYQPYPYKFQWTKDHPLEQVTGEPS
nr:hypothetical protein [Tanacetum cinerariifolium]